jgi:transcriptional regulator
LYVAEQFAITTTDALAEVAARGVGDLITHGERGIDVTYLPFVLLPDDGGPRRLTTHVARTNQQWQDEGAATWVVHGPDAYISPGVVPAQPQPQRMPTVPTWNYLVVHLRGRLIAHHDDEWKLRSLRDLTARHEPGWRLENGPLAAIERMLPAIVGIEFVVDAVIGKAKMSQNRSSADLLSMAATLADAGHSPGTGEVMRRLALPYIQAREERVAQARELQVRRKGSPNSAKIDHRAD